MFLATLDESISMKFQIFYEANIQNMTTKRIKESKYKDNNRVLSFEDLIGICLSNVEKWKDFNYTIEQKNQ